NDDVAGQGLVEDHPNRGAREPRHVARGGEDSVMRGEMQACVQPAEGGAPRNEVHDNLDAQRPEWLRRIRDNQNLLEETLVGIDDPLDTGTPADFKKAFVEAKPAALSPGDDQSGHEFHAFRLTWTDLFFPNSKQKRGVGRPTPLRIRTHPFTGQPGS